MHGPLLSIGILTFCTSSGGWQSKKYKPCNPCLVHTIGEYQLHRQRQPPRLLCLHPPLQAPHLNLISTRTVTPLMALPAPIIPTRTMSETLELPALTFQNQRQALSLYTYSLLDGDQCRQPLCRPPRVSRNLWGWAGGQLASPMGWAHQVPRP